MKHSFVDGNRRVAFLAVGLILAINGLRLVATQADATMAMLSVVARALDDDAFARWLRERVQNRK